jgi:hypothetical protein
VGRDERQEGNDFLAVIDADPHSASYGKLVASVGTDQKTVRIHHTEYEMPASGMLFANDHDVGRTFIFDVKDPLHPKVAASFVDMDGYMHPHSYVRLPNGVPTIVDRYLAQSVPAIHGLIALDISNAGKPREVSRVSLSGGFRAHWTGWDAKAQAPGHHRLRESSVSREARPETRRARGRRCFQG